MFLSAKIPKTALETLQASGNETGKSFLFD
jgi:hypothetical protein